MDSSSMWELIKAGKFDEAIQLADEDYPLSKDTLTLRNKVFALLHVNKYKDCVEVCRQLIDLTRGEVDKDFIYCGIAYWALDRKREALNTWQKAQKTKYTDAAGGIELQVLLYFAAVRLHDDLLKRKVITAIRKLLKNKRSINFPGPLGSLLVDNISLSEVSIEEDGYLQKRMLCQIYFAKAVKELENGSKESYYRHLNECLQQGPMSYLECGYYLAKAELETLAKAGQYDFE